MEQLCRDRWAALTATVPRSVVCTAAVRGRRGTYPPDAIHGLVLSVDKHECMDDRIGSNERVLGNSTSKEPLCRTSWHTRGEFSSINQPRGGDAAIVETTFLSGATTAMRRPIGV